MYYTIYLYVCIQNCLCVCALFEIGTCHWTSQTRVYLCIIYIVIILFKICWFLRGTLAIVVVKSIRALFCSAALRYVAFLFALALRYDCSLDEAAPARVQMRTETKAPRKDILQPRRESELTLTDCDSDSWLTDGTGTGTGMLTDALWLWMVARSLADCCCLPAAVRYRYR